MPDEFCFYVVRQTQYVSTHAYLGICLTSVITRHSSDLWTVRDAISQYSIQLGRLLFHKMACRKSLLSASWLCKTCKLCKAIINPTPYRLVLRIVWNPKAGKRCFERCSHCTALHCKTSSLFPTGTTIAIFRDRVGLFPNRQKTYVIKGTAIPLQAWTGPWGFQKAEAPGISRQSAHEGSKVVVWRNYFIWCRRRSFALHSTFMKRFNVESISAFK
jgi:hypothetical protein